MHGLNLALAVSECVSFRGPLAATIVPRMGRDAGVYRGSAARTFAAQESVARPQGGSRPTPQRHQKRV